METPFPLRPLSIAHRGASAYAPGNTIQAFRKAAILGADMWEVDIRATLDGVPVVFHDAALADGQLVATLTRDELRELCPECPDLAEVIALAVEESTGIYADIKDKDAALAAYDLLSDAKVSPVIIGAFDPEIVRLLNDAGSSYPVAGLVPVGVDPHEHARDADVIHLCWEHMDRPQDGLSHEFFLRAFSDGKGVVLWHEEDPARMTDLRTKPVIGICSDMPELVKPFLPSAEYPFGIVCHRGANKIAPENTLPALECALAAGFSHIEVDLHVTTDGHIVVIHDTTLQRTTSGEGTVAGKTLEELRTLDAGSWFDPFFDGTKIPMLTEVLDLLERYDGKAYLELKSAPPGPVLDMVVNRGLLDRVFFWSFNRDYLVELRRICPEATIMSRRMDYPTLGEALRDYDADIIEFRPDDDPMELASLRGSAVRTMIAYSGGQQDIFDRMIDMRPDMFNLDQPFEFSKYSVGKLAYVKGGAP